MDYTAHQSKDQHMEHEPDMWKEVNL
jgi:hypothetical protein